MLPLIPFCLKSFIIFLTNSVDKQKRDKTADANEEAQPGNQVY